MGREQCGMCHYLGDEIYCDYYDLFYRRCYDIADCPGGLDDDDDDDDDEFYGYDDFVEFK